MSELYTRTIPNRYAYVALVFATVRIAQSASLQTQIVSICEAKDI